jgi:uncharacterized membrane protein
VEEQGASLVVAPSLLVLGFLVVITLALAKVSRPLFYGLPMALEMVWLFLSLAVIFVILAAPELVLGQRSVL